MSCYFGCLVVDWQWKAPLRQKPDIAANFALVHSKSSFKFKDILAEGPFVQHVIKYFVLNHCMNNIL